jgi:hypothetical protein
MHMSPESSLRLQLQDDFSHLKLALEVLERAKKGCPRPFVVEWLTHVEQSADNCIQALDKLSRSFFIPDDAHCMIDHIPLAARSVVACRS